MCFSSKSIQTNKQTKDSVYNRITTSKKSSKKNLRQFPGAFFWKRDQIFELCKCEREGRLCWCQLLLEKWVFFVQKNPGGKKKTFQAWESNQHPWVLKNMMFTGNTFIIDLDKLATNNMPSGKGLEAQETEPSRIDHLCCQLVGFNWNIFPKHLWILKTMKQPPRQWLAR